MRWIKTFDAHGLQPLREPHEVIFESSKRHVTVLFAGTLAYRSPEMRMPIRVGRQEVALRTNIKAELVVEVLGHCEIWHNKMKLVDRMDAKFSRTAVRLNKTLDGRHRTSTDKN